MCTYTEFSPCSSSFIEFIHVLSSEWGRCQFTTQKADFVLKHRGRWLLVPGSWLPYKPYWSLRVSDDDVYVGLIHSQQLSHQTAVLQLFFTSKGGSVEQEEHQQGHLFLSTATCDGTHVSNSISPPAFQHPNRAVEISGMCRTSFSRKYRPCSQLQSLENKWIYLAMSVVVFHSCPLENKWS